MISFLEAWVHHWGWAWMCVGLIGWLTLVVMDNDDE